MATSNFKVLQRGIKAFPEGNRIDFILEDPEADPVRATVFFNDMDREVKLGGSKLTIMPPDRDDDGELLYPNRLSIRWGRKLVNLGLCQKEDVRPYYYRGLESESDKTRPATPEDLFKALGF